MGIPDLAQVREISNTALYTIAVDKLVQNISEEILATAKKGGRHLRYPYAGGLSIADITVNDLAFARFKDAGYLVEEYGDNTSVKW